MGVFFVGLNYGMKFVLENDIRHGLYYTNLPRNIMNYWLLRLALLFEFWRFEGFEICIFEVCVFDVWVFMVSTCIKFTTSEMISVIEKYVSLKSILILVCAYRWPAVCPRGLSEFWNMVFSKGLCFQGLGLRSVFWGLSLVDTWREGRYCTCSFQRRHWLMGQVWHWHA